MSAEEAVEFPDFSGKWPLHRRCADTRPQVRLVGPHLPINPTISQPPPCGLIVLLLEWASLRGPYALHASSLSSIPGAGSHIYSEHETYSDCFTHLLGIHLLDGHRCGAERSEDASSRSLDRCDFRRDSCAVHGDSRVTPYTATR